LKFKSNTFIAISEKRLELFKNNSLNTFKSSQIFSMLNLISNIIPKNYSISQRELVNIVLLDIINTYKGWRHLKGLPVRNQRTWSNGWTSYKHNLKLRNFKFNSLKQLYSNLNNSNINTIYLAEHVNLLWKLQWESEWNEAKKKRLIYLNKNKTSLKVDLNLMANLVVSQNSKKLDKKKKPCLKKTFLL